MNDLTDDELLLDMIVSIALDVLERIGNEPERRYAFIRQYVDLAKRTVASVQ